MTPAEGPFLGPGWEGSVKRVAALGLELFGLTPVAITVQYTVPQLTPLFQCSHVKSEGAGLHIH